jgi:hypothetical protein
MSNVIMKFDAVRRIYLLDLVDDAKGLDEFVGKIIVVRIAWLLIKLEHLPLVDSYIGHLVLCIQ